MIDVKTKYVSVVVFNIKPDDLPAFAREGALIMQRKIGMLHGFVEGAIMANDQKTEVVIVSQWESREDWSQAPWDEDIGRTVSELVESAKTFDVRSYEPITIVRAS